MAVDPLQLFLEQVSIRPDHPAVVTREGSVTYAELWRMASRMAWAMAQAGDHPKVLIQAAPGAAAYAAMFAALCAGGFYVPVNISAPIAKQRALCREFGADLVVADATDYRALVDGMENPPPLLAIDSLPVRRLDVPRPPHDLAYVIFTSGSTGVPKGVMLSRAGLANYTAWARRDMAVTPDDRWSQHPNIGFDLSVLDIYGALCGGATLYRLSANEARLMPALAIRNNRLTIWNSVPSVIDIMRQGRQLTAQNLASLRLMTFCGEPLLPEHLEAIFAARPDLLVHNTYGPTEATVSCTLVRLRSQEYRFACSSTVAVGAAIDNMAIHLLGGETPDEGEIVITGPQLARGYWNNPQATETAFRRVAIDGVESRAYFTGDWGQRVDGQIYFRNRIDFQVKISGYRVELDEINAALRKAGFVAAATILIGQQLHAFVETPEAAVDEAALRESLSQQLEPYAIPSRVHPFRRLPRSANDKVDLRELARTVTEQAGG